MQRVIVTSVESVYKRGLRAIGRMAQDSRSYCHCVERVLEKKGVLMVKANGAVKGRGG